MVKGTTKTNASRGNWVIAMMFGGRKKELFFHWNETWVMLYWFYKSVWNYWTHRSDKKKCWGVQGQVEWDSEQPDVVGGIPPHDRGVGTRWYIWFFPIQTILWVYSFTEKYSCIFNKMFSKCASSNIIYSCSMLWAYKKYIVRIRSH